MGFYVSFLLIYCLRICTKLLLAPEELDERIHAPNTKGITCLRFNWKRMSLYSIFSILTGTILACFFWFFFVFVVLDHCLIWVLHPLKGWSCPFLLMWRMLLAGAVISRLYLPKGQISYDQPSSWRSWVSKTLLISKVFKHLKKISADCLFTIIYFMTDYVGEHHHNDLVGCCKINESYSFIMA